eukprot:g24798.t1
MEVERARPDMVRPITRIPKLGKTSMVCGEADLKDFKRSPMSLPSLPPLSMPLHQIYSRRWTTESKRYLHVAKERKWMALQHKHRFLDFSPKERAELKRYFDELAGENRKIALDQLETMFISLGLAEHPKDVQGWTERVDDLQLGELDFEQFLELLLKRTDSDLVSLFREMASGKLGDPSLNFQTIISEYRRKLIMGAAGVGNIGRQQLGSKVLHNFAALQRSRWEAQAAKDQAQAMGLKSGEAAADVRLQSSTESSKFEDVFGVFLPFQQKKALNQTLIACYSHSLRHILRTSIRIRLVTLLSVAWR